MDQAVYAPLWRRRLVLAVLASGLVGAAVDSALFLWLAFGSLDHLAGQVVGKTWMVAAAAGLLWWRHRAARAS
jgi:queuosine precursor transporter